MTSPATDYLESFCQPLVRTVHFDPLTWRRIRYGLALERGDIHLFDRKGWKLVCRGQYGEVEFRCRKTL
jgi:hypothetical protein